MQRMMATAGRCDRFAVRGCAGGGRFLRDDVPIALDPGRQRSTRGIEAVESTAVTPALDQIRALPADEPAASMPGLSVGPDAAAVDEALRARIVGDLYKSSYHRVFCFARRFIRDEEAEEVAHEAFVRLLRVRNLERMTISVAYLLRIAENLLKRRHERALRYRHILEESGRLAGHSSEGQLWARGAAGGQGDSGDAHGPAMDPARLESALSLLTREEQAALRLIVCEGLDYDAAARSLGVPVSTINNWKHRGLSKLRKLVGSSRIGA